ncbi:MAG: lysoplasmalogenase [Clostridia bacterium]|nr:lysoplasmalogenase [Clostridia bacterium]
MAPIIISCGCGAAFLTSFLITCNKKRSVTGVFNKATVSVFFIITAVIGLFKSTDSSVIQYGLFTIIGLIFGLLGDIFLDQKWVYPDDMAKYLNCGFIVFGIGHIVYITSMFRFYSLGLKDIIFPAVFMVVVWIASTVIGKLQHQVYGQFKLILNIYTVIIAFMVGTSLWLAFTHYSICTLVYAIGAVFFLLSDLILSPMYFKEGSNTPINMILNHITYYIGQYMISLSIFFIAK